MARQRIGIFGGTFDPIHRTHIDIARAALHAARLDQVIFVVSARPPHKREGTHAAPEQRLAMVQAALADEPHMSASDIEFNRKGPSYTAETLELLAGIYPDADFFLIVGMDALLDLPKWKQPDRILAHARLLAFPRVGETASPPPELENYYEMLAFQPSELSSTAVREMATSGQSLDGVVPEGALRIIREENIYGVGV